MSEKETSTMDEIIWDIRNVVKSYSPGKRKLEVLRGVNWQIRRNSWTALLGASGSGKTTLLNILGTLERPDSGEVLLAGESMHRWSSREAAAFRARRLGYVFQAYQLLPELTLIENVELPARLAGMRRSECRTRALTLLERFGLQDRTHHHPPELSGGEQQRGAIARALVKSPDILLADEPTGNLDTASGESILALLDELRRADNLTIVMITHNEAIARRADEVAHLVDGVITDYEL